LFDPQFDAAEHGLHVRTLEIGGDADAYRARVRRATAAGCGKGSEEDRASGGDWLDRPHYWERNDLCVRSNDAGCLMGTPRTKCPIAGKRESTHTFAYRAVTAVERTASHSSRHCVGVERQGIP